MGKPVNDYIKYTTVGFQMIVIIGALSYIGYRLDANAHHDTPWVTAAMSLAGVFISLYLVIRSVRT